jgi:hypothetical protein
MWIILACSAIIGGILSSQTGTGADIAYYACSCFLIPYIGFSGPLLKGDTNTPSSTNRKLADVSVIIMASTSVNGSIFRVKNQNLAFILSIVM